MSAIIKIKTKSTTGKTFSSPVYFSDVSYYEDLGNGQKRMHTITLNSQGFKVGETYAEPEEILPEEKAKLATNKPGVHTNERRRVVDPVSRLRQRESTPTTRDFFNLEKEPPTELAKLREEYVQEWEKLGGTSCPSCQLGGLRRKYIQKIKDLTDESNNNT